MPSTSLLNKILQFKVESCGTVPNPEKSRLSRGTGQTGLSRKFFGAGQKGFRTIQKKSMSRILKFLYRNVLCTLVFLLIKQCLYLFANHLNIYVLSSIGCTEKASYFHRRNKMTCEYFFDQRGKRDFTRQLEKFGTGQTGFGTIRKISGRDKRDSGHEKFCPAGLQ